MAIYLGIDPGLTGAIAMISEQAHAVVLIDTPTTKVEKAKGKRTVYDDLAMFKALKDTAFPIVPNVVAVIETLHAMPKIGSNGNFGNGLGYGLWVGMLRALGIPFVSVHPVKWKRALGIKSPGKDADDSTKKNLDRLFACELFPQAAGRMNLVKHHGRADALLLAEYGRRHHVPAPPLEQPHDLFSGVKGVKG